MIFKKGLLVLLTVAGLNVSATLNCESAVTEEADSVYFPFPNPNKAQIGDAYVSYGDYKLLATGYDGFLTNDVPFTVDNVLQGYRHSIFPFIQENGKMHWFSMQDRGVLDFADFHLNRTIRKHLRKANYTVTMNHSFRDVVLACADSSKTINPTSRGGTWISNEIVDLYTELHKIGYAHSVEVWADEPEGKVLAGGVYGVLIDGVFFGESLFTRREEAGRLAVAKLVEFLKSKGFTWMDIQMVTPTTSGMGAKTIPRAEFLQRLRGDQLYPLYFPVQKLILHPTIR